MAIRFRSTALAIGAALAFVSGPTLADPALWAVRSNGSTVYLFGTIHAIDPSKVWRTPALDSAFGDSSELWLEVPLPVTSKGSPQPVTPEETQQIVQLVVRLGTTRDGPPLSSRLTTAEAAKLTTLLPPMPKGAVDRMRPWLVAPLVSGALDSRLDGLSRSETLCGNRGQGQDLGDGLPQARIVIDDVDQRPARRPLCPRQFAHWVTWETFLNVLDASATRLSIRCVSNGLSTMAKA